MHAFGNQPPAGPKARITYLGEGAAACKGPARCRTGRPCGCISQSAYHTTPAQATGYFVNGYAMERRGRGEIPTVRRETLMCRSGHSCIDLDIRPPECVQARPEADPEAHPRLPANLAALSHWFAVCRGGLAVPCSGLGQGFSAERLSGRRGAPKGRQNASSGAAFTRRCSKTPVTHRGWVLSVQGPTHRHSANPEWLEDGV